MWVKVWLNDSPAGPSVTSAAGTPGCDSNDSACPGSELTVWFRSGPTQLQRTASPGWTLTVAGMKL